MRFHDLFDGFDNDYGVIDDDADRQDHRKERDSVGGIPDGVEDDEGPDQANRHRNHRNERGADVAEENEDDEQHKNGRFHERMLDGLDRGGDECGWVVGNLPGDVLGKRFRAVIHQFLERFDGGQCIGAGRLIDADKTRRASHSGALHDRDLRLPAVFARWNPAAGSNRPDWCG